MDITFEELKQTIRDTKGDTTAMAKMLGVSRRTAQRWKRNIQNADERGLVESAGVAAAPDKRRSPLPGNRFVFTTAQNNTPVHMPFFKALRNFCDMHGAAMYVAKQTYNKSGFQNLDKDTEGLWYDENLAPYFHCKSADVVRSGPRPLVWCGELDILPTAIRPLSGLTTYTRAASGIVPHVKLALESIPTTPDVPCKMMYTTGAVTLRNYIQRKTGQKADFHHVFGALYVEVDKDGDWFARQLVASEDGSFYDLDKHYSAEGVVEGCRPAALTLGDIHAPQHDPQVLRLNEEVVSTLRPAQVVLHDLVDFSIRSHWNINDPYHMAATQTAEVKDELAAAANYIIRMQRAARGTRVYIAPSNHIEHMRKWLATADYRKDPVNAIEFLRLQRIMYENLRRGDTPEEAFWSLVTGELAYNDAKVLRPAESHRVLDVELGMHGHLGPCGARGNAANLSRINTKVTIGHTHSARIIDGVYSAGTSSKLDMGYNRGPSNWSHSHVIQYPNGKRAIITYINGKWRA